MANNSEKTLKNIQHQLDTRLNDVQTDAVIAMIKSFQKDLANMNVQDLASLKSSVSSLNTPNLPPEVAGALELLLASIAKHSAELEAEKMIEERIIQEELKHARNSGVSAEEVRKEYERNEKLAAISDIRVKEYSEYKKALFSYRERDLAISERIRDGVELTPEDRAWVFDENLEQFPEIKAQKAEYRKQEAQAAEMRKDLPQVIKHRKSKIAAIDAELSEGKLPPENVAALLEIRAGYADQVSFNQRILDQEVGSVAKKSVCLDHVISGAKRGNLSKDKAIAVLSAQYPAMLESKSLDQNHKGVEQCQQLAKLCGIELDQIGSSKQANQPIPRPEKRLTQKKKLPVAALLDDQDELKLKRIAAKVQALAAKRTKLQHHSTPNVKGHGQDEGQVR